MRPWPRLQGCPPQHLQQGTTETNGVAFGGIGSVLEPLGQEDLATLLCLSSMPQLQKTLVNRDLFSGHLKCVGRASTSHSG